MATHDTDDTTSGFDVLLCGEMHILGRMPWSSNATFLVELVGPDSHDDEAAPRAIYKPLKGERPLWDYPTGLYRREAAAHELSAFLGWDVIPRTVARQGPYGIGSVQRFVDADFEQHYFTIRDAHAELDENLRRLAVFDLIANSGDRKSGHVLIETDASGDAHIYGIDNGLSFHDDYKLRTVMWDYAGDEVSPALLADVERLAATDAGDLGALTLLLRRDELDMLVARAEDLLAMPVFPHPPSNYAYPWT